MRVRDLLPESSRGRWAAGGLMDRELDAAPLLERAQLMCAQVGALQALNQVHAEMLAGLSILR